jgi:transcription elongation factor GreA
MSEKKKEKPTHLTKAGLQHYQELLDYLKGEKTIEIANRLEIARGFGDLSENSEYDEAKEAQRENEAEKARIEAILSNYVLIDEDSDTSTVKMGHVVVLYDCDFDEEDEFYLVGSSEADPLNGKISNESPVGAAILGRSKGEKITVKTPAGESRYVIKDIKTAEN